MAGVWVRITCGVTFSTTLAVTDASGPFFKDLPANMIGCFIIGLLADGATALRRRSGGSGAGAGADDASLGCAVAALPLDSAQQTTPRCGAGCAWVSAAPPPRSPRGCSRWA